METNSPIQILFKKISDHFGASLKNYGEAIRSLSTNQAANYITVDNSRQCSVDDSYRITMFVVRESAETTKEVGGGNNRTIARSVTYRMAVNSDRLEDEFVITNFINQIPKMAYNGTSFDQAGISAAYFGILERNTASAFFTISFSVVEKIDCQKIVC